jgi:hypothetical protein
MLSGKDEAGENRMGAISMSGLTRERGAAAIGLVPSHAVLSSLLHCVAWCSDPRGYGSFGNLPEEVPTLRPPAAVAFFSVPPGCLTSETPLLRLCPRWHPDIRNGLAGPTAATEL